MTLNPFGIIGIIIAITSISIGFLVFLYDRKNRTNQIWLAFAVSIAIWGAGSYLISITQDQALSLVLWRITYVGVILIPFLFISFIFSYLQLRSKYIYAFSTLGSIFFLYFDATSSFIFSVERVFDSFFYLRSPSVLYNAFVLTFLITVCVVLCVLVRSYNQTSDSNRKKRIVFLILASLIGFGGGSTSFFPVYGFNLYPYLNAGIIFSCPRHLLK